MNSFGNTKKKKLFIKKNTKHIDLVLKQTIS